MYFSLNQALQLIVISICFFAITYLVTASRRKEFLVIPVTYFLALSAASFLQLIPLLEDNYDLAIIKFILIWVDGAVVAISFLLICQLIFKSLPNRYYWAILLIPLIFALPSIYLMLQVPQICINTQNCFNSVNLHYLVNVVLSGIILVLLTILVSRHNLKLKEKETYNSHKYWLIVSLIIFNVFSMIVDLAYASSAIDKNGFVLASTTIKIAFLYLAISSIFRVFFKMFLEDTKEPQAKKGLTKFELEIAQKAKNLLQNEKVYRDLKFNRGMFASQLGIKEHQLSIIIRHEFNKSFSEIANEYRINEAKDLLISCADSITSISFEVGFNSLTSFNRVFKESVGKSPSQYRTENKECMTA